MNGFRKDPKHIIKARTKVQEVEMYERILENLKTTLEEEKDDAKKEKITDSILKTEEKLNSFDKKGLVAKLKGVLEIHFNIRKKKKRLAKLKKKGYNKKRVPYFKKPKES